MDELLVANGFTAYSKEIDTDTLESIYSRIFDEGYFDEIEDRLKDIDIILKMEVKMVWNGNHKFIFEGVSKNTYPIDTEEVQYIFYNLNDDFQDLQLKFYNTLF